MNCPTSVTPPSIAATVDSSPLPIKIPTIGQSFGLPNWQYVGCSNDTLNGKRVLGAKSYTNTTNMTVEACQTYCASNNYKYAGLGNAQEYVFSFQRPYT